MQHIKLSQRSEYKTSPLSTAYEYVVDDDSLDMAIVEISGRYPEVGFFMNKEVKEMLYIMEGGGELIMEDETINISKGDVLFLDKNEKYAWDGQMTMVASCAPKWWPEQHLVVE